jgi:hypothetical protein
MPVPSPQKGDCRTDVAFLIKPPMADRYKRFAKRRFDDHSVDYFFVEQFARWRTRRIGK